MKKKTWIVVGIIFLVVLIAGLTYYFVMDKKDQPNDSNRVAELETYLKENYSKYVIDGSTSMIPLHEALEKKFGTGKEIQHSKTVSAFNDFVDGKIDILLAVDYLDKYFQEAEAKNVTIQKKEITKEALVFLKNKDLAVDDLTLDQLKQIYHNDIKNWNEIKNLEEEHYIIPVMRNEDSGSGMAMMKLLGIDKIDCTDGNCVFVLSMNGVINLLASGYKSYGGVAIAFNMYTFSEKQYHNDNVKMFKINGVMPTDETIYNEEYPILLYNYIYYKNDESKEFGEKLYEYLKTDAGQKLIQENGYIPLEKQDNVDEKNNLRDCKNNFIDDETCVKNEGYNKEIDKFVKITTEDGKQTFEYFDTQEDYIFANSKITKEEFEKLKPFLNDLFKLAERNNISYTERTTFEKNENGDFILNTGNCGGTLCMTFGQKKDYKFEKSFSLYNQVIISKDIKTFQIEISDNEIISIPINDLLLAFDVYINA